MTGGTLTAPLRVHAAARPVAPALRVGEETLSWADLDAAVEIRAREIASLPPGGVALRLSNSVAAVVFVLAAARAGREAQVLDPAWPAATAAEVVASLRPARLVTECPDDVAVARTTATTATTGKAPVGGVLSIAPRAPLAAIPPLAPPAEAPLAEPDPASDFYVGFTSGSTGVRKGYRRSQRSWVASFAAEAREFAVGADDTVVVPGAFVHSLSLYAVLSGLHAGARVVVPSRFRPDLVHRLLSDEATVVWGVPTHHAAAIERAERAAAIWPRLRLVLSAGAKWPDELTPRLRARAPVALFAEFYGASELSFVALARADEDVPEGSVGRPFSGVDVVVRDRAGRRLPAGRRGLVHVASDLVFTGYACGGEGEIGFGPAPADPGARREASVGDAGFLDARGFLHLCGRWKRMIVTSGRNVHPEEIECVVETRADVAAASVHGVADARRGERLVGVVAVAPSAVAPSAADLVVFARAHLPLAMVPRRWHRLDAWPLTASAKTDHVAVAAALARGETVELL